jgi:Family of unknown function (DUF6221)
MADLVAFIRARLDEDERELLKDPPVGLGYANLPARIRCEVEAKRAILARYTDPPPSNIGDHLQRAQERMGLLYALEQLASAWQDHPDYDPAWSTAVIQKRT